MAEIADGTYQIVPAVNTNCAIECRGATDENHANVRINTKSNSDSQFITVVTNDDGSRRLIFTLSGKAIDIKRAEMKNKTNVQQYTDNGTRAQKWNITADGKTVTIGDTSYDTYVITSAYDSTFALDLSGGNGVAGTNIQIYTVNGTIAQRWAFISRDTVPEGTYLIRSAIDPDAVIDVSGGSQASGANLQLWGSTGSNSQVFHVKNIGEGLIAVRCTNSDKYMAVDGDAVAKANVSQQKWNDSSNEKWYAEPRGTMTINDVIVPTYRIHYYGAEGSALCLDAAHGLSDPGTNVRIYTINASAAERWAFQPYSMLASALPVPASLKVGTEHGTYIDTPAYGNSNTEWYPSWICSGTVYQARYRVRTRSAGKPIGSWSEWRSIIDGLGANSGWGDVGSANCTTENTPRKYSPYGVTMDALTPTGIDYAEIQFEIRRFEEDYNNSEGLNAHGNSLSVTVPIVYKPTLSITGAAWSPEGILLSYTSDYKRDGNTITIESATVDGKAICGKMSFTAQPYTGTVLIPQSSLNFIPDEGTTLEIKATLRTDAAAAAQDSISVEIAYNYESGLSVRPKYIDNDGYTVTVKFSAGKNDSVYLMYGDTMTKCSGSGGVYTVIPPLNTDYRIFVASTDGSKWGMASTTKTLDFNGFVWNWDDGCAVIRYNKGDSPSYSDSMDTDNSELTTTGRARPVYAFGNTITRSLPVGGIYADEVTHGAKTDMDALAKAHHTTFRDPKGQIFTTAILSVKCTPGTHKSTKLGEWGSVSVEQKEETL